MSDPFVPRPGAILSADIAVPEHARELRFYSRVLSTGETPLWREDLMNSQGTPIIGLGERVPEYAELPLQWMPHILVADVTASADRALALGGKTIMRDENDQWAVFFDPSGAAFGIMPVPPAESVAAYGDLSDAGRIAWLDLTVPDASTIRDFYGQVIGWSVQDVEMEDAGERYADYSMCGEGGSGAAGVCHARGVNQGLPAVWMIYLPVGDLAESLRLVEEEGGKVLKATRGKDGELAYAAIEDPVGVSLALMPG